MPAEVRDWIAFVEVLGLVPQVQAATLPQVAVAAQLEAEALAQPEVKQRSIHIDKHSRPD